MIIFYNSAYSIEPYKWRFLFSLIFYFVVLSLEYSIQSLHVFCSKLIRVTSILFFPFCKDIKEYEPDEHVCLIVHLCNKICHETHIFYASTIELLDTSIQALRGLNIYDLALLIITTQVCYI